MAENKKGVDLTKVQHELQLEVNSRRLELDRSIYKKTEQERIALKVAKAEAKKRLK